MPRSPARPRSLRLQLVSRRIVSICRHLVARRTGVAAIAARTGGPAAIGRCLRAKNARDVEMTDDNARLSFVHMCETPGSPIADRRLPIGSQDRKSVV